MNRPKLAARVTALAAMALIALALPSGALAGPTGSQITSPSDSTFVTATTDNPNVLHIAGTTSGGTGDVDVRCYHGLTSDLIAGAVPVVNGDFSVDVSMDLTFYNTLSYPRPYCVLRGVPTGTTPAAPPEQASPFAGPHVGWGRERTFTLGIAGAPNPPSTAFDYSVDRAQSRAYNDYDSAGSCGLCDTYLFDPSTFQGSNPIWWGNAALYAGVPSEAKTRSAVQVDGIDVYDPSGAATGSTLKNNPGFPSLSHAVTVDPSTGDLTIDEGDPFVACASQPATYPPDDVTCPSFGQPLVQLHRRIVQDQNGLQVTITDRWTSNDGQSHQLDAIYDDTNENYNASTPNHHSLYDFAWTGAGFATYPDDTQIAPPASAPATVFIKSDATTPDAGDGHNPFGALTYGAAPSELKVQRTSGAAGQMGDWQARYQRTIPAAGELVITQVYSHDFSLASVQALAHEAELAVGAAAPLSESSPGAPTTADSVSSPPAASTSVAAAPPAKCKVPKLRGRTLRSAKRLLVRAHCRLGKVTRKASARVRPGRVVASKPKAGSLRTRGARIAIALAKES